MTAPVIILARAGTKYLVRVVPLGPVDHDQALATYSKARTYAHGLSAKLPDSRLDDRCEGSAQ